MERLGIGAHITIVTSLATMVSITITISMTLMMSGRVERSKTEDFTTMSGKPLSGKSKSLQISDNVKNDVFTNFFCSKEYLDKIIESQESLN